MQIREEKCPESDYKGISNGIIGEERRHICTHIQRGKGSSIVMIPKRVDAFLEKHFSGKTMTYRNITALVLPLFVDQMFLACLNLFNTLIISNSGLEAVSAVKMVDSINSLVLNVLVALATGGTIVVAHCNREKEKKQVYPAMRSAVFLVCTVAMVLGIVISIFSPLILAVLFGQIPVSLMEQAEQYMFGSAVSYFGFSIMEAVCGALRGVGRTRSSLVLTITMHVTYFGLNYLFITIGNQGIRGMMLSMIISRYLAAGLAVLHLLQVKRDYPQSWHHSKWIDMRLIRKMFTVGGPFASEQIFFNGGKIITQTYIVGMGTLAIATDAIATALTAIFQIPANTFALAIVTIVGRCIANHDSDQAKKSVRSFVVMTCASFLFMGVVLLPFLQSIVSVFGPTEQIERDIFVLMLLNTAMQGFLWAGSFLVPAALRAAGDLKFTSATGLVTMWVVRVALGYVLGVVCGLDVLGIWLAMEFEWAVRAVMYTVRFRSRKWMTHPLVV